MDGIDVRTVKIWDSMTSRERIIEALPNNTKVAILEENDEYVKVATVNGKEGWCMKGFIK